MEYRKLGRTDLSVSSVGMGCVTFGREIDAPTSLAILDRAIDRGINLLDTAAIYGEGASEEVIGQWMAERNTRDKIVLASKVSITLSAAAIRESVEASLRRLGTDVIDLLQMHSWDANTPLEETLEELDRQVQQGNVRYIGCSNWSCEQLSRALQIADERGWAPMQSIQPPYNLVQREIEPDTLPLCIDKQIGVLSYSPLGAGFLTGKYREGGPVPEGTRFDVKPGHQPIYFTEAGFRIMEGLRSLSRETGRTMIDLALAWVIAQPGVTSVLVGARHPDQLDQPFAAEATGLSDQLREQLESL